MTEPLIRVPSAVVEVNMGGTITPCRMFGMAIRDKGKAILAEVTLPDGRSTLVPWRDVTSTDGVGLYLLGPEKKNLEEKKTEKT